MEEILKTQREKQEKLKAELGKRWQAGEEFKDLVFTTGMGSPCSRYIVQHEPLLTERIWGKAEWEDR